VTLVDTINSLFFTDGAFAWLGLIIFLLLLTGLIATKNKIVSVLTVPIAVLLGLYYLNYGLGWHSIIMFITAIGLVIYFAKEQS
jgi:hypothetical protein